MTGSRYEVQRLCVRVCVCVRVRADGWRSRQPVAVSESISSRPAEEQEMVGRKGGRREGEGRDGGEEGVPGPGGFAASTTPCHPLTPPPPPHPSFLQPVTAPPSYVSCCRCGKMSLLTRTNTSWFASFLPAAHSAAFI